VNFTVSRRCFTIRLLTSQPGGRRGGPVTIGYLTYLIYAGCLVHAGKDRQQPGQIGEGKKAEHQLLRGGPPQLTPRLPGLLPGRHHRRQAAAVNEGQSLQIHNDPRARDGSDRQRARQPGGMGFINLSA
jgi:hypothetical protein